MKKLTLLPLVALFLLFSLLIAEATPSNPVWAPSSTTFLTNSMPVVGNGTNAFSVITADINGDGRLDLISAGGSASGGALTILTNNGNGFGSNATYTVGSTLFSVTAADINGDASVDLVCSMTNGAVLVLTNNGLGVFGSNATYITGPDPVCVTAVADLDGHGLMALVTANNNFGSGPGTLTVLTNNGGGIYVSNTAYAVGAGPRSVVAADINGDGLVDLITANFNSSSLTVLTNNGSGKFVLSATLFTSISAPDSVTVADVNGDGRPDLICANFVSSTPGTLTILTNIGNGNFVKASTPGNFTGGLSWPTSVTAVTNFDGRGEMALIAANYGNLGASGSGSTLTVLTNNGTGVFGSNATLHVGTAPASIAVGDFNGDGRMDLASAHGGTNTLSVLFNVTAFYNVTFTAGAYGGLPVSAAGSPTPVLSVSNAPPLPAGVLLIANTNGTGVLGGTPAIGSGGVYNFYLLASNFNISPLVVTQKVSVTINQQPIFQGGALGLTTNYTVGNEPYSVAVADVNGDGKPDLITANYNNGSSFGVGGTLTVLTNNGFGGFGSNTSYTVGTGPRCVIVVTNLDGRGLMALVSANYGSGSASTLTVLTNNGGGIFVSNTAYSTGQFGDPVSVTAADINGDGYVDLIAANYNNNTLTVFTNNGNGAFKAASTNSVGINPDCVIAADLLGNGKMDLISANYNNDNSGGTLSVLTNNGSGIFTLSSSPAVGQGPLSVVAADIYGNGRLALISGNSGNNSSGSLTVLTNNGKGIFGSNATLQANSVQSVTAVDINGDGHVDLVSAQNFSSSQQFFVDVYTNDGSGVFGISPLTYVAPGFNGIRPYSVVAADINGDGRVDLITANLNSGNGNTVTVLTNGVPTISPALTEAAAGNYTVLASGFPAPVFSENGALPGGVTFTAGGIFTGTPNTGTPGTYSVVVTSSNVFGISSQSVNLIITPAVDLVSNVFSTAENTAVALSTNSLLANATDLDGFLPLTLTAVAATSTNGGTVVLDGGTGLTTYTPVSGFTGLDEFSYTVMDANSDTAQGTALVVVIPPGNPSYNNMATTGPTGTQLGLQYTGVPGQPYYVQSATNVAGPYTDVLPVVTANSNGLASKTIIILLSTPARYYRVSNTP